MLASMNPLQPKPPVLVVFDRLGDTYRERDDEACNDELPVPIVLTLLHLERAEEEQTNAGEAEVPHED